MAENNNNNENKSFFDFTWLTNAIEAVQNWWKNNISPLFSERPKKTWVDQANESLDDINLKIKMLGENSELEPLIKKADLTKAQEGAEEVKSVTPQIADEHSKQNSTIAGQASAFLHDVFHGGEEVKAHLEAGAKHFGGAAKDLEGAKENLSNFATLHKAGQEILANKGHLDQQTQKEVAAITENLKQQERNESRAKLHDAIERSKQVGAALASERVNASKNDRSH